MTDTQDPPAPAVLKLMVRDAISVSGSNLLPDGAHRLVYINPDNDRHVFKRLTTKTLGSDGIPVSSAGRIREDLISSVRVTDLKTLERQSSRLSLIEPVKRLSTAKESSKKAAKRDKAARDPNGTAVELKPNKRLVLLRAMCHQEVLHEVLIEKSHKPLYALATEHGVARQQVKRLFYRLLDVGLDPERAAARGYSRAGKQKNRSYEKKQGRPLKMVKNELGAMWRGLNTDDQHRRDIATFIQSGYRPENSKKTNYRDFKQRFAVRQIHALDNGNIVREMLPEEEYITYSQFTYHLQKLIPAIHDRLKAQTIEAITLRAMRIHIGNARSHILCPGHTLLIDSTVADVHLVCCFDRAKLIGRPILYFVVDALTSTIVGLHIGLRSPSGVEAKIALYNAMSDKTAWLNRYGLGAYAPLFPCAPHPHEVLSDRAELHSIAGRAMSNDLSFNMGYPPPYQAAWKGIVERLFRTTNDISIHWLPGSTRGRARERGERDVRLDAVLTLDEFIKIILYGVLLWNQRGSTTAFLPPEVFEDEVSPGPVGYYNWGLQNLHGSPRYFPQDEMIVRLLEPHDCRVAGAGIELDRLRWVGDWMKQPDITLSGLIHQEAQLYRDPHNPKEGFVRLHGEQILRPVHMHDMPIDGTERDIEEYQAHLQAAQQIHLKKTENLETTLLHHADKVVVQAKHLTKQAKVANPQSNASFLAGLDANRAAEINNAQSCPSSMPTPAAAEARNLASSLASRNFLAGLANLSKEAPK
ncbi:hypothetical protein [Polaromonas sp.]|uniref:hypothetical protein n=1 Tax=Polaromonas sp. TaxID=1869339 RepID=UPI003263E805